MPHQDDDIQRGFKAMQQLFRSARAMPGDMRWLETSRIDLSLAACGLSMIDAPTPSVELCKSMVKRAVDQIQSCIAMLQAGAEP